MAIFKKKTPEKEKPAPKSEALEEIEPLELEEVEPIEEIEEVEEVEAIEPIEEVMDDDDDEDDDEPVAVKVEKKPEVKAKAAPVAPKPISIPEPKAPSPALELDDDEDDDEDDEDEKIATDEVVTKEEDQSKDEAYVAVIDSEGHETIFALDKAVLTFGRDEKCNIVIPDKKASRKHFVIEMAGDYYNIIDAGSTNGTKVNGKKISSAHRLREGDYVVVGQYKLVYHGPSDQAPAEPPTKIDNNEITELPEEAPPPKKKATPQAALADDAVTCAECGKDMPENAPCECGYKSLKLRAQEHFVDTIARGESILGGIGLWKLKRQKALDKAFAMDDIEWVLENVCDGCGKRHRIMNEFRVKCEKCDCGKEVSFPAQDAPKLD